MSGTQKIALVTGAGSGVGRASALALAHEGYQVVITGRRKDALEGTVDLAKGMTGACHAMPCDVSDAEQVAHLFAAVKEKFGRLDVLFNNRRAPIRRLIPPPNMPLRASPNPPRWMAVNMTLPAVSLISAMRRQTSLPPCRPACRKPMGRSRPNP